MSTNQPPPLVRVGNHIINLNTIGYCTYQPSTPERQAEMNLQFVDAPYATLTLTDWEAIALYQQLSDLAAHLLDLTLEEKHGTNATEQADSLGDG